MPPSPSSVITFQPQPLFFGMAPIFPSVKPGHAPLHFVVDWSKNAGFWNKVVVKALSELDGTPCDVFPREVSIPLGDGGMHTVLFNFTVSAEKHCKFVVEMHRVSPQETFVVDPGIILNPGP